VVAQVTERNLPDDTRFTEKKAELQTQARRAKEYELTDAYLKALQKQGKVIKNTEAINTLVGG
jgi:peptidyl-prolyl cis-trans isomerase D